MQKSKKKPLRENSPLWGYLFILPNFLSVIVFVLIPIVASLYLSFTDWDLLNKAHWVGVSNYVKLITKDRLFKTSLLNTVLYAVYTIPIGVSLSLILALLLNSRLMVCKTFFRSVFFLPHVCTLAAVALVWKWFYNAEFGILNYILESVGLPGQKWLSDRNLALPSIAAMSIWKSAGYNMVILVAGLQGIPSYLYEAADLDGARGFTRFRYITFPMLMPSLFFIMITATIGSFQVFDSVMVMTRGGPANQTLVYNYYLYQNAFQNFKMGYASAMAYILFIIIVVITILQFKLMGKRVSYDL
ncbi:MAG: sugar ABC transporter permease [Clostridia bacterium]|nr:sugar ABC transporter permease [Clostridia bacterium]